MTLHTFLASLPEALKQVDAELLTETRDIYPNGRLIRVRVPRPGARDDLPGMLDLIGAVCFAKTGEWYGMLDYVIAGARIGLSVDDILLLSDALDQTAEVLRTRKHDEAATLRGELEAIIETVFAHGKQARG